jgi:hypothetical protein
MDDPVNKRGDRKKMTTKRLEPSLRQNMGPISLNPLTLEEALKAAIETGPITDPKLKKPRKRAKKSKE